MITYSLPVTLCPSDNTNLPLNSNTFIFFEKVFKKFPNDIQVDMIDVLLLLKLKKMLEGKEFLDIQATIECRFILKRVRGMIITYSQMHRTDK